MIFRGSYVSVTFGFVLLRCRSVCSVNAPGVSKAEGEIAQTVGAKLSSERKGNKSERLKFTTTTFWPCPQWITD